MARDGAHGSEAAFGAGAAGRKAFCLSENKKGLQRQDGRATLSNCMVACGSKHFRRLPKCHAANKGVRGEKIIAKAVTVIRPMFGGQAQTIENTGFIARRVLTTPW